MTENFYKTGTYKVDYKRYAGEITPFDFEGHHTLKTMTNKILRDYAFDRQCEQNIRHRNDSSKNRRNENA